MLFTWEARHDFATRAALTFPPPMAGLDQAIREQAAIARRLPDQVQRKAVFELGTHRASARLFDTISNVLVDSPLASWMLWSCAFISACRAGSNRRHCPSACTMRAATCGLSGSSVSTSSARKA